MKKGYKKCPFCGNEIKEGAIKCQFCEEFLGERKTEKKETTKEHVKKNNFGIKKIIYIFVALVVIGLLICGIYYFVQLTKTNKIQFIQEQQEFCESKYKDFLADSGYVRFDDNRFDNSHYSHTSKGVNYVYDLKSCIGITEKYGETQGDFWNSYDISNLSSGITLYRCEDSESDGAKCMIGCDWKQKKGRCIKEFQDTNNLEDLEKMINEIFDSEYIKIQLALGIMTQEQLDSQKDYIIQLYKES